jgi:hypothetical protein
VLQHVMTINLSKDQESLIMMFLIGLGPRQAIRTKISVTEQDLRYSLSIIQDFKALSFLYAAVKFEGKNREQKQEIDLQLGSIECRAYQSVILEPKHQCQLDYLRKLHILE